MVGIAFCCEPQEKQGIKANSIEVPVSCLEAVSGVWGKDGVPPQGKDLVKPGKPLLLVRKEPQKSVLGSQKVRVESRPYLYVHRVHPQSWERTTQNA